VDSARFGSPTLSLPEFKHRFQFSQGQKRFGWFMMKLYVGNLSFNTSDSSLAELFAAHGEVTSASIVMDRETGRSRGFGFVEFSDDNAAKAAIAALNGANVDGRDIVVNEARPRENRGGGGGRGFGGGGGGGGGRGRGGFGGGGGGGGRGRDRY